MPEQDDFAVLADHERFMWGEGDHNDRVASAREFDAALGRLRAKVAALEEAGEWAEKLAVLLDAPVTEGWEEQRRVLLSEYVRWRQVRGE